ncbi:MAG: hypothetical protein ACE5KL_06230 [Alphaproteobacteria bacterium]
MLERASPFTAVADGLKVALRVTPKAGRNRIGGLARRRKLLHISGEPAELMGRLKRWLEARHD